MTPERKSLLVRLGVLFTCLSAIAATIVFKYSDFPNTSTLADTDLFLIAQPGVTNKNITWAQLRAQIGTNGTQVFNINTNYTTNAFITFQTVISNNVTYQTVITNTVITQYVETNYVNNQFITNVLYVTEVRGGKVYVTNFYANDGTFTNGMYVVTNTWANAPTGAVAMHIMDQYVSTYTPISITGITSKSNTVVESVVMTITNGAATNITGYLAPGIMLPDRTSSFTASNASQGVLSLRYHPGAGTNAIWKQW